MWQRSDERADVQSTPDRRRLEETWGAREGVKIVNLVGNWVANLVGNLES